MAKMDGNANTSREASRIDQLWTLLSLSPSSLQELSNLDTESLEALSDAEFKNLMERLMRHARIVRSSAPHSGAVDRSIK